MQIGNHESANAEAASFGTRKDHSVPLWARLAWATVETDSSFSLVRGKEIHGLLQTAALPICIGDVLLLVP